MGSTYGRGIDIRTVERVGEIPLVQENDLAPKQASEVAWEGGVGPAEIEEPAETIPNARAFPIGAGAWGPNSLRKGLDAVRAIAKSPTKNRLLMKILPAVASCNGMLIAELTISVSVALVIAT